MKGQERSDDSAIPEGTFSEAAGQETLSTESLSDLENV